MINRDITKLHLGVQTILTGLCILIPFSFINIFLYNKAFFDFYPLYLTIVFSFCLSIFSLCASIFIVMELIDEKRTEKGSDYRGLFAVAIILNLFSIIMVDVISYFIHPLISENKIPTFKSIMINQYLILAFVLIGGKILKKQKEKSNLKSNTR